MRGWRGENYKYRGNFFTSMDSKESNEDIFDALEVNASTKKEISLARAQHKKGEVMSLEQIKKELLSKTDI